MKNTMLSIAKKTLKSTINSETIQHRTSPEYLPMDVYVDPRMTNTPSMGALMLLTLTRSYLAIRSTRWRSAA